MKQPPFDLDSFFPDCLIRDYAKVLGQYDSVPPVLHAFAGMAAFGCLFGGWVNIGQGAAHEIDPLEHMVLVAPSAVGKGGALSQAERLVSNISPGHGIIGGRLTMEGILSRLPDTNNRALILSEEMGATFGEKSFTKNFEIDFTDLMDNKDITRWHTKGTKNEKNHGVLYGVKITALTATTKSWIEQGVLGTALEKGFASRVLWVWYEEPAELRKWAAPVVVGLESLYERGRRLHEFLKPKDLIAKPLRLSLIDENCPGGREYSEWFDAHQKDRPTEDVWETGWWGRKKQHYLQIGLILSLACIANQKSEIRKVELIPEAMVAAGRLLDWAQWGVDKVHTMMKISPDAKMAEWLLSKLHLRFGGMAPVSKFHQAVQGQTGRAKKTSEIMGEMVAFGYVKKGHVDSIGWCWVLTDQGKKFLEGG